MAARYVPDAGDIVWLNFDPQAGREQAGRRPALGVSPAAHNGKTGLMICCPMTSQIKGYPFEVLIAGKTPAAVLADHAKSLDWWIRKAQKKGRASIQEFASVRAKIHTLI